METEEEPDGLEQFLTRFLVRQSVRQTAAERAAEVAFQDAVVQDFLREIDTCPSLSHLEEISRQLQQLSQCKWLTDRVRNSWARRRARLRELAENESS